MEVVNKTDSRFDQVSGTPQHTGSPALSSLRLLGVIYAIAFLVTINQFVPLIGSNGLLPVGIYLKKVSGALGSDSAGFMRLPSLFWLGHTDTALLAGAWIGFVASCVVVAGYANVLLLAVLWFLYMSFVHVGQEWYG